MRHFHEDHSARRQADHSHRIEYRTPAADRRHLAHYDDDDRGSRHDPMDTAGHFWREHHRNMEFDSRRSRYKDIDRDEDVPGYIQSWERMGRAGSAYEHSEAFRDRLQQERDESRRALTAARMTLPSQVPQPDLLTFWGASYDSPRVSPREGERRYSPNRNRNRNQVEPEKNRDECRACEGGCVVQ